MIKGKTQEQKVYLDKSTVNYRKLDALNQSMLKLFDTDPVKFFEEFKMGKKRKEKTNVSLIIGDLVDFYLLECQGDEEEFENRFDEKFALFNGNKGTGQVFVLADILFEITQESLNENNEITSSFEDRFKEAYHRVQAAEKYKGKTIDKVLDDFHTNGKDYFDMLMSNIGKTVVDISLVDKAKIVANKILTDDFTRELFQQNDHIEVFTHFPIEFEYEVNGEMVKCKAEIDRLEIDHVEKIIQPDDLKTTYDNESFDYMYVKNSYYLQNAFYHLAVKAWAKNNELGDYEISPMRFIVGDTSANNRRPLIFYTSTIDLSRGLKGFMLRGNWYRGVEELMTDISWAEKMDMWNCSREAYEKNGKLNLNVRYDYS